MMGRTDDDLDLQVKQLEDLLQELAEVSRRVIDAAHETRDAISRSEGAYGAEQRTDQGS